MRAIVQAGFGVPSDVLTIGEVDTPPVQDDAVLVKVHAAGINIGAVYGIRGYPKVMRPIFRAMTAKSGVVGFDLAGTVEAVGTDVTGLEPGDEVFGWGKGAFAEYAATSGEALLPKPTNLTLEQAAAIGTSAFTALQALNDYGDLQAGQQVLVTGASGGVGTYAVQIAKSMGAEVTGADHVIDYTEQDFTLSGPNYDLIVDNVGAHSMKDTRRALTPDGVLLSNGGPAPTGWFGGLGHPIKGTVASMFVKQQGRTFVASGNKEDLATLKNLAETGEIVPVIDRTYALDDGVAAIAYVGEGHNQGTTVITM
jgi:NADPH:quinone reductase-like Zn-dependent oxidoreductase